jgi:hypothetical protein
MDKKEKEALTLRQRKQTFKRGKWRRANTSFSTHQRLDSYLESKNSPEEKFLADIATSLKSL